MRPHRLTSGEHYRLEDGRRVRYTAGAVFVPTEGELAAFRDRLEPVELPTNEPAPPGSAHEPKGPEEPKAENEPTEPDEPQQTTSEPVGGDESQLTGEHIVGYNVSAAVAAIRGVTSVTVLRDVIALESAREKPRKTIIEAAEKRLAELGGV